MSLSFAVPSRLSRREAALAPLAAWLMAGLPGVAGAGPLREMLMNGRRGGPAEGAPGAGPALPAGARSLLNQSYGPSPAQAYDAYLPASQGAALPLIFMVHGGAWAIGDKAMGRVVDAKVARWVARGIALVSVNYRMLPEAPPDVQLADVALALQQVRAQAPGWGVDPARVVLMGHSAGAHLVALLAAQAATPVLGTVALDSAAMDLTQIMGQSHMRLYDRPFGTDPAYWRAMSPTLQLRAGAAPVLAVCSTRRADSCAQAQGFVRQAGQMGVRANWLGQDLSHGEINAQLGLESAYTRAVEDFMAGLDPVLAQRLRG